MRFRSEPDRIVKIITDPNILKTRRELIEHKNGEPYQDKYKKLSVEQTERKLKAHGNKE